MEENRLRGKDADEPPPFLGRWARVYAAEVSYLAALIALFWLFGRLFTP